MLHRLEPFELERYFARHEFTAPFLMCSSDVEAPKLSELLELADDEGREWWQGLRLGYVDYPGDLRLRREIAALYRDLDGEQVYCFCGAQEAISVTFQALLQDLSSPHVIVTWPGYQSLYEVARACGAEVSLYELRPEEEWRFSLERLEQMWRPQTRLVVVNFPHNPTGSSLSASELEALARFCEERDAWLFSDEVYRGLPADAPAAVDFSTRALSLGVMSKSYGLAGLRVGWLACREPRLLQRIGVLRDYTTICGGAPNEALALIGLRAGSILLQRAHQLVSRNQELFAQVVAAHRERLEWVPPRGGTMAFPRLLGGEVTEFATRLRETSGVLILPASVYGYPRNHFRVGFGRSNFAHALERFEAFLAEHESM